MVQQIEQRRRLEGRQVCLVLADGSRFEDCRLVSAGRGSAKTVWIFTGDLDVFLSLPDVAAVWETDPARGLSAA